MTALYMQSARQAFELAATVPMEQVAAIYGLEVDGHHLALCPFHNDRRPSLKIYPDNGGWYCFVCGFGGDGVEFVRRLLGTNALAAARDLCGRAGLMIPDEAVARGDSTYREKMRMKKAEAERWSERAKLLYTLRRLPLPSRDTAGEYARSLALLEWLEYFFENAPCPSAREVMEEHESTEEWAGQFDWSEIARQCHASQDPGGGAGGVVYRPGLSRRR